MAKAIPERFDDPSFFGSEGRAPRGLTFSFPTHKGLVIAVTRRHLGMAATVGS